MLKSTMARKATKTRAELIALLKSRGIKGRVSKMTKPPLLAKGKAPAPPEKAAIMMKARLAVGIERRLSKAM